MTTLEKRALYHLLRMHWLNDPHQVDVESWQVEDYRHLPIETLFDRLRQLAVHVDEISFVAYAEECDSPEDLTEYFIGDREINTQDEDRMYLLVFELWRRLVDKPSLSIFCNDLDQLISLYDQDQINDPIVLQETLIKLLSILNENIDAGIEPKEAFKCLSAYCANDLETFLYDFISQQIDEEHESYAQELIDGFALYFVHNKWFDLLRAKLMSHTNPKVAHRLLLQIIEDYLEEDLDFNLELLSFIAEVGTPLLFQELIKKTIPMIKTEEDFQDLLAICIDYYHRLDRENVEYALQNLLNKRINHSITATWKSNDPDLIKLLELIHS